MKCLNCAKEIDNNVTTCQYCGTDFLSPQSLKDEQEKNSVLINCEKCGKQTDQGTSYTWIGGKIAEVREVDRRHETTKTAITYQIKYNVITPVPIGFCSDCYKQRFDKMKSIAYVILSIVILVPLSAFLLYYFDSDKEFVAGLSILVVFLFLPALDGLKIYMGKDKNKISEGLSRSYANSKKEKLGLDILWNQKDYLKLIGETFVNERKSKKI